MERYKIWKLDLKYIDTMSQAPVWWTVAAKLKLINDILWNLGITHLVILHELDNSYNLFLLDTCKLEENCSSDIK